VIAEQPPALVRLALDVSLGGLTLGPCSFGAPWLQPSRQSFPAEPRRSDGRSSWSPSPPWRSGTGCRRSGPTECAKRGLPIRTGL